MPAPGDAAAAHRIQGHVEEIEAERLGLEFIGLVARQPHSQQVAQHHRFGREQGVGRQGAIIATGIEPFGRQRRTKSERNGAVADAAGKADAIGRVGGKEHRVTGRADDVATGRVMLGKHAAERQRNGIQALPLDLAAGIRAGTGLEQADLQRVAFKRSFTADFKGRS